jgi:hypothetical protein
MVPSWEVRMEKVGERIGAGDMKDIETDTAERAW